MEIHIDLPSKRDKHSWKNTFFISVGSGKEVISFDHTTKGHRILKQKFIGYVKSPKRQKSLGKPNKTWQTLKLVDGKPKGMIDVKWFDKGKIDIANREIWKTVWEKPMSTKVRNRLHKLCSKIYENRDSLDKIKPSLKELDEYISKIIVTEAMKPPRAHVS
jgi:hypothetical protein